MSALTRLAAPIVIVLAASCAPAAPVEIEGTISYRERIALPAVATARVYLVTVDSRGVPSRPIGEFASAPPFRVPMPFVLQLESGAVASERRYQLRGEISVDGQLMFFGTAELGETGADFPAVVNLTVKPAG